MWEGPVPSKNFQKLSFKVFWLAAPENQVFDSGVPSLPGCACSLTFFREVMSRPVTDLKVPKWNILESPHWLHCPSISNPVRSWWWACDYPVHGSKVADVEVQAASPHTLGWSWVGGGWVGNLSGPNYQCVLRKGKWVLIFCALSHCNCVRLFATLWTVACQAPLTMGFSRQEYWNGLPCTSPGHLPDPGIEPESLMSPAMAARFFTTSAKWGAQV